ncbi:YihY/virulence factor BrkB family protein [Peribacillus loiseleuriae]|uniref:YihY/virulence factor BrkB family protein n=1 Tax=Peribacillus loiseleuriae TaxID=1679170 RepID=UPI0038101D45
MKGIAYVKKMIKRMDQDDVGGLAAQLAYFFLLSLFPLLLVLISLLPYLPISEDDLLTLFRNFAPSSSMALIEENINQVMQANTKLLSFGIIATIWSASNGLDAIVRAFNRAYKVEETRNFFAARGMSILLTIAMIFVFVVALLLPVFGKQLGVFLFSSFGLSEEFLQIWNALRWFVSGVVLILVFIMLYWLAPNKKMKCLHVAPGAFFATGGWIVVSLAFSYYVDHFGGYTTTYGSLGGIIVLMIWFYLTGIIIIIGGEINALSSERKHPTC